MKKITPNPPETDTPSEPETLDLTQLSKATQRAVSARLRDPKQPDPCLLYTSDAADVYSV